MRIGVISDTHRALDLARKVIKDMGNIDLLIHAGDHYQDAMKLGEEFNIEVKNVVGNCDYLDEGNSEELINICEGKIKIFLVHGHQYKVKMGLQNLYYRGLELGADIIIFGHTHIPLVVKEGDIKILNPGSIGFPRGNQGVTYGLIEIGQDPLEEIKIKLKNI
ncbi:hypothetical protein SAMN00017405_0612 [Desulfonispora thiosulfatigenes DSM 11270]|uniref:Phosphoesterase n=1 Tax=Desulfonispora thiosulfatigenes DSM 11270 TaxID=656914 RepID=A0A1W1V8A2_DESTI|nr:metallophosphoesterase [Desulfonispora thiosulfatigenes]SMB89420.1 hypothetical protein SAMN00017405_0612 [Desulfonispora thiosulfatigenes DSM 11270]